MFNVYQHWDPLKVCLVGRSYPPEFYSWIKVPHVRKLFERIARETEEDFQSIIAVLQRFGVQVMRPELPFSHSKQTQHPPPPLAPRDVMCMIGDRFYEFASHDLASSYQQVRDASWPDCHNWTEFANLPAHIQDECLQQHGFQKFLDNNLDHCYKSVFDYITQQGNTIRSHAQPADSLNGAMVSRIGRDLYFGTRSYDSDRPALKKLVDREFPNTRNHIVNTGGHSDATFCPVCPGLIISLHDVPTYADTFPGWEVVYLKHEGWNDPHLKPFLDLKTKNRGRWWIPGFENDQSVIDHVEKYISHWTGYVEETVFDVNMLIIDPKNVIVFNYNKTVFDALERYGITPHVVTFRHRYFWDGGIHCVTVDLDREGHCQDFFPNRE